MGGGGFGRPHDHVFDFFESISASDGHGQLLAFEPCIGSDFRHTRGPTAAFSQAAQAHQVQYMRQLPHADFALIRHPQEHDRHLTPPGYGLANSNPQ
jgi:hypothetical protein